MFDEQISDALEEYADQLEREMVEQAKARGNPVGYIVRLKALRPQQYIEKHVALTLSTNADIAPGDPAALLARMLPNITDATRRKLQAMSEAGNAVPGLTRPEDATRP